jgi:hypothetical protein
LLVTFVIILKIFVSGLIVFSLKKKYFLNINLFLIILWVASWSKILDFIGSILNWPKKNKINLSKTKRHLQTLLLNEIYEDLFNLINNKPIGVPIYIKFALIGYKMKK